jgi:hypothetical protein
MFPGSGLDIWGGVVFFVLWVGMMILMVGGWVITILALWRGMKAHESLAESVKRIVEEMGKAK